MRTINISVSELEFNQFGLTADELSSTELIEIISREISGQNFRKSMQLSKKFGLFQNDVGGYK